jgi:hypothetical protein
VPHIQALRCAPLQQPELQPDRRGGEYRRRDDEDAERNEQVGVAAVLDGNEREEISRDVPHFE